MISENLSKVKLSPTNSNRNGFYFSSVLEVHFIANVMGWSHVTVLPLVRTIMDFCARTMPKVSLDPLLVTIHGPLSTGSEVMIAFSHKNTTVCCSDHQPSNVWLVMMWWYTVFENFCGSSTFLIKFLSSCLIFA